MAETKNLTQSRGDGERGLDHEKGEKFTNNARFGAIIRVREINCPTAWKADILTDVMGSQVYWEK